MSERETIMGYVPRAYVPPPGGGSSARSRCIGGGTTAVLPPRTNDEGRAIADGETCGTCGFWFDARGTGSDECRRRAPVVGEARYTSAAGEGVFPSMCVDDPGCGEYRKLPIRNGLECPKCGCPDTVMCDEGTWRGKRWMQRRCQQCGRIAVFPNEERTKHE